jgi:tellurite resistance protein TerC
MHAWWLWLLFNVFVLGMLALDLGVFHKHSHEVSIKEATVWSVVWITLALLFCGGLYFAEGAPHAIEFLTGYLIEKSLSMDNIFVFVMIFSFWKVPKEYQHRVLFWGVLGALLMRAAMIFLGAALIAKYTWILLIFGAFLVYTGIKMVFSKEEGFNPEESALIKWVRKLLPITTKYEGKRFFTVENGKRLATPLFLVLVMVEASDLIFAVDSIPAIFGVTKDAFLVYTSNVFAILGLRSLYFLLAGIVDKFHLLKYGLAFVLTFVGVKMLLAELPTHYHFEHWVSLLIIAGSLLVSIAASLLFPEKTEHAAVGEKQSLEG